MNKHIVFVYFSVCECLCVCGNRKAENDSEWRTNPFGHIAESNTKYQNLIISIIIFIIFIHFLAARLNAASLTSPLSLPLLLPLYINLFFSPLATHEPVSQIDWQHSSGLWKSGSFFFRFFLFFWSDVVLVMPGPYQETQFITVSLGERGCHSRWLTALRFAGCSVGISFKLICFWLFCRHCRRLFCSSQTCVHSSHRGVAERAAGSPCRFVFVRPWRWFWLMCGDPRSC